MAKARDGKKKSAGSPVKKDKDAPEKDFFVKSIFYNAGLISKDAAEMIKNSINTTTYKKAGKAIGAFQNNMEAGWKNPEEVIRKDKIKIKGKPLGLIAASFARRGADELGRACEVTARSAGKVYKKGRIAVLIKMWKAEHPGASGAEEAVAAKEIRELFKG